VTQTPVASWDDAQYSFNLVRSSFTDHLGLVIYSKRVNADAELHIAEAMKLEEQEGPQKEADRLKKTDRRPGNSAAEESEDFSPVALAYSHKELTVRVLGMD